MEISAVLIILIDLFFFFLDMLAVSPPLVEKCRHTRVIGLAGRRELSTDFQSQNKVLTLRAPGAARLSRRRRFAWQSTDRLVKWMAPGVPRAGES